MKISTDDALDHVIDTLQSWLPGYTDTVGESPHEQQYRVKRMGEHLYQFESTDGEHDRVVFHVMVSVWVASR